MCSRSYEHLRANLMEDTHRKIRRSSIIHRDDNYSAQDTSEKSSDPFSAILTPDHQAIALGNPALLEDPRKTSRAVQYLAVGKRVRAISTTLPVGTLIRVRAKIL
jgi:hypothetical protein